MNIKKDIPKFIPTKYNRFYWWRRFKSRDTLHKNFSLIERIKNGDFDYSDYRVQALYELELAEEKVNSFPTYAYTEREEALEMGRRRYNRLMEDFMKDEFYLLQGIKEEFCKWFWISEEEFDRYMNMCDDGLIELYELIKENTLYKFIGTNRHNQI
jgi:hypothetical protein